MSVEFSNERERLDAWLSAMWLELEVEFPEELPEDFPFDFDRRSLAALEALLLDEFASDDDIRQDENKEFHDRTARYVGETLRKSFRGEWKTGSGMYDGVPVVVFPGSRAFPESPFHLVDRVLLRRTGGELARVFDGLTELAGGPSTERG